MGGPKLRVCSVFRYSKEASVNERVCVGGGGTWLAIGDEIREVVVLECRTLWAMARIRALV